MSRNTATHLLWLWPRDELSLFYSTLGITQKSGHSNRKVERKKFQKKVGIMNAVFFLCCSVNVVLVYTQQATA